MSTSAAYAAAAIERAEQIDAPAGPRGPDRADRPPGEADAAGGGRGNAEEQHREALLSLWTAATQAVIDNGGAVAMLARLDTLLPPQAPLPKPQDDLPSTCEIEIASVLTAIKSFDNRLRSAVEIQTHERAKSICRRWLDQACARRQPKRETDR